MNKKSLVAFLLALTMLLTACTGKSNTGTDKPDSGKTSSEEKVFQLHRFLQGTADKVQYVWQDGDGLIPYMLFRTLLMADSKYKETKPDLAQEMKRSEDGLEYKFVMKKGLKWSDGKDLAVDDVLFSIKAALRTSMINGIFPSTFLNIEGALEYQKEKAEEISGIKVENNTITIKLLNPLGNFEQMMAQFYILPKHVLEKENILELNNSDFWNKPVTSGMYKVTNVSPGNYIEFGINEHYENQKPKFNKVVLNFISDPILALQDNKAYFYSTNKPQEISQLDGLKTLTKYPINILFYRYFIVNLSGIEGKGNSLLENPKVREAILYAINRKELSETIFKGISDVNYTGVPTALEEFLGSANKYEYNPEKAKQLLKEANYDSSKKLQLAYYYNDESSKDFMQAVSYQLDQVGIKNELTHIQSDATGALFNLRKYDLGYKGLSSFGYEGWYGEYTSDNTNFKNILNADTSFDALTEQLNQTSDNAKRKEILEKLQKLEQEKLFKLNLFTFKNFLYLNTDKVKLPENIEFGNPFYKFDYRFEEWDAK